MALAQDYGIEIAHQSPTFKSMERQDNKLVLTFDAADGGLMSLDTRAVTGFSVAGADNAFVNAQAMVVEKDADGKSIAAERRNQVVVWSEQVAEPVAVRYAWANNPRCNLQTYFGLPGDSVSYGRLARRDRRSQVRLTAAKGREPARR